MRKKLTSIKNIILLLLLGSLVIPFIQDTFHVLELSPLKGAITQPEKVEFSVDNWLNGSYQEHQEKYITETFGLRSFFIRIYNQLFFSLFHKAKANGVIVGKENYLYEENYIKAYYGTDFIGYDSIDKRMQRLKFLHDTLAKLDKNLMLIFAPGKGSFYPEYFPERYKTKKSKTNYETHLELAHKYGISHIDFNQYFIELKKKSAYPLYPQFGIHWSHYGSRIAEDSILRYIENRRHVRLAKFHVEKINMEKPKEGDYDIAEGMNLLCELKTFDMAYPQVSVQDDSLNRKPSLLTISDSYYWYMFNFGMSRAFSPSHYWYYNKQIYPDSYQSPIETSQVNIKEEIEKHDIVIILATEATLNGLGWGFIENAVAAYRGVAKKSTTDPDFQMRLANLRNYIKTDRKWLTEIEKKAKANNVSIDSMITLDATWQLEHSDK